jgi:hypothetical protein
MMRTAIRVAAIGSVGFFLAGIAIMFVGAQIAGDWYALQLPWSEIGMILITIGLGGSAIFVALEDLIEPIGRWRLLAIPGIAVGAWFWFILLVFGLASTGRGPQTESPVFTLLYSAPQYIAILSVSVAVAASTLPLLIVRPWGRTAR